MTFRRENPLLNTCNNPDQEAHWVTYNRDGMFRIHMGEIHRDLLSIIALPRWRQTSTKGGRKQYEHKPFSTTGIVHNQDVDFLLLWDRPRNKSAESKEDKKRDKEGNERLFGDELISDNDKQDGSKPNKKKKNKPAQQGLPAGKECAVKKKDVRAIQTVSLLERGYLTSNGEINVRSDVGTEDAMWVDIAKPMFYTHQETPIICRGHYGDLRMDLLPRPDGEPTDNVLRLVRFGDYVDFCFGNLPNGDLAAFYRFDMNLFCGSDPRATLEFGEIPAVDGQVVEVGLVSSDTVVIKMRKPCDYAKATIVKDEQSKVSRLKIIHGEPPHSWDLTDDWQTFLFRKSNEMNSIQCDIVLDEQHQLIGDPNEWAPSALVEFSPVIFERLAYMSDFRVNKHSKLMTDLIEGLRPNGTFRVVSLYSGVVTSITTDEHEPRSLDIMFDNDPGRVQSLPAFCSLLVREGDTVSRSDAVAIPMVEGYYSEEDLHRVANADPEMWAPEPKLSEADFRWLVGAFLRSKAIQSAQSGVSGVLIDVRYVNSVLYCAKRTHSGINWYWDFRKALFLAGGEDIVMFPPAEFSAAQRNTGYFSVGEVLFRVGTPTTPDERGKKREYRKTAQTAAC